MAGCKRRGERGREEKRKGKRRKNGNQNRFFFCACVFHMRSGHFSNIRKTVSILRRSYRHCLRSKF